MSSNVSNTPKTDGDMMNCCNRDLSSTDVRDYRYENINGKYTSCFDPSTVNANISCNKDRNGNTIYACFPPVGEQLQNCHSSCLNGHQQDINFGLNNGSIVSELPIAERGVELYENYGLDTNVRTDSGNYGIGYANSGRYGLVQCMTELGRKITLFGNIDLHVSVVRTSPSATYGTDTVRAFSLNDIIYEITVYTNYNGSKYNYFGNHGITFNSNGRTINMIHGKIDINAPYVATSSTSTSITYYFSNYGLLSSFYNQVNGYPENNKITTNASAFDSGCTKDIDRNTAGHAWFYGDVDNGSPKTSVMALFPVSYLSGYFNDNNQNTAPTGRSYNCGNTWDSAGPTNYPYNCYASGTKSMYIPPHMAVTNISYIPMSYDENEELVIGGTEVETNTTVLSEHSMYSNGVFPAFGSTTRPAGSNSCTNNRNAVIKIPPGSMNGIKVRVRQDDTFYNKYISSADDQFAPEILLIPGIGKASGFPATMKAGNLVRGIGDPLQLMRDPNQYWSTANPNWNESMGRVVINTSYRPGQVIASATDAPVPGRYNVNWDPKQSGNVTCTKPTSFTSVSSGIYGYLTTLVKPLVQSASISLYADDVNTDGLYRITSFDVISGVYSIEWLYVLWYCAMKGRSMVQWDSTNKKYYTPGCQSNNDTTNPNSCGWECMLYRDDYYYQNAGSGTPRSDVMMAAYCGMRNISLIYSPWQTYNIATNECSCSTTKAYCPTQFNPSLCSKDPTKTQTYVSADQTQSCNNSFICSYCNVVTDQIIVAAQAACVNDSDNSATVFGDVCGGSTNCNITINTGGNTSGTTNTGGNTGSDDGDDTSKSTNVNISIIILLLIIVVVIAFAAVVYIVKYRKKSI